jgi:hypothetical protein
MYVRRSSSSAGWVNLARTSTSLERGRVLPVAIYPGADKAGASFLEAVGSEDAYLGLFIRPEGEGTFLRLLD